MSEHPSPGLPAIIPAEHSVNVPAEHTPDTDTGRSLHVSPERCLNCDAPLTGEYCSNCGQHSKHHVHSTAAMLAELVEDLFHTDHRVWRTLAPLLFRPGKLTVDYLRGKRVTYTPPFRLYIVLSLLFFLTTSLSQDEVKIVTPDGANIIVPGEAPQAAGTQPTYDIDPDVMEQLDDFLADIDADRRAATRSEFESALRKVPPEDQGVILGGMTKFSNCSPAALERVLPDTSPKSRQRLLDGCRKVTQNSGEDFSHALSERAPQVLFFFLPLIALFAKILYIGSRRYYAEHVLFFVHCHAFVFLLLALNNVIGWLLHWIPHTSFVAGLLTAAVYLYFPLYLFRAMRNVYGQGRFVTGVKFFFLMGGYVGNMLVAFAIVASYTAMTLK